MLQAKNLKKTYRTDKGKETKALKGVSVDFGEKGLVFILGKSGCGKSTFLHLLGGLDKPDEGEIIIDGKSSKDFTELDFDSYRNTYVGFVFQEYNLIDSYSVGENIALALELQGKEGQKSLVEETMRKVGLVDEDGSTFYERKPGELSGGQKQRVAIARALVKEPEILLADEPTGALDSETGEQLYDLLKELSKEKLIVVVTHDRESAEKYGDRIIELKDGAILSDRGENGKTDSGRAPRSFLRGKLPFRRMLSLGAKGLQTKKFRLVSSIVLSFIVFVAFGLLQVLSSADFVAAELAVMEQQGAQMAVLSADNWAETSSGTSTKAFSDKQLAVIEEYCGEDKCEIHYVTCYITGHLNVDDVRSVRNPYLYLATINPYYAVELDPAKGEEQANLTPDPRFLDSSLCRLPETATEVAITDMQADAFIRFGYRDEEGNAFAIATPDDLIGKTISGLTICGVYQTDFDKSVLEKYNQDNYGMTEEEIREAEEFDDWTAEFDDEDDKYLYSYGFSYHITPAGMLYMCKGAYAARNGGETKVSDYLIKIDGDADKYNAMIKEMTYQDRENDIPYSAELKSAYHGRVSHAMSTIDVIALPAAIGAGVLTVFSVLLSMSFLSVSIDFRKREIGILRALGAKKSDVAGICLSQSGIIAGIEFVLSLAAVLVLTAVCNAVFNVSVFYVGAPAVLVLVALSFGVSALATVFPVRAIVKKKPVDIIRESL